MSIFATSPDPMESAVVLCDDHLRSQMSHTAGVLAGALYIHGLASGPLIRAAIGEPSKFVRWASLSWDNFMWLSFYGLALAEEHSHRFGNVPPEAAEIIACANVGYLISGKESFSPVSWEMCDEARNHPNLSVFEAHQKFLSREWLREGSASRWTAANPPPWVVEAPR